MKCRHCNSINTRVTATEHHGNESWRYCRCLDCEAHYKTIETYAILKRGSIPGVRQHVNCRKRGVDIGTSVLTEENVVEIRRRATENQTYVQIAKRFGIHQNTVYRIVKRKLWAHVD
jgi:DNA-binding CsgD family transcriptional regulator